MKNYDKMTLEEFQKRYKKMLNDPIGFVQEYLLPIKKKRGRPRMIEQFFYNPYKNEQGYIIWDGDTLKVSGTVIR